MSRSLRLVETGAGAENALRVAVATNDMEHMNAHFGSARMFAVYDVTPDGARFVAAHEFGNVTKQQGKHDDQDDKITPKVEALAGCALLFTLAIGGPSAAKVVKAGIHPIKRRDPQPLVEVLSEVQVMLAGTPPPFLRKILGREARPDFLEDDYEEMVR
jgi:nitrogen fixation protein NifX